jgi:HSP20 family protein
MLLRSDSFRDVDRVTARVFDTATRSTGARLDAYRHGDTFYVDIDLPGVDPSSTDVTIDSNVLTLRAECRPELRDGVERLVSERPISEGPMDAVTREVVLADTLDTDHLEATYDDGVLILSIPVTEKAKPQKGEIADGHRDLVTA